MFWIKPSSDAINGYKNTILSGTFNGDKMILISLDSLYLCSENLINLSSIIKSELNANTWYHLSFLISNNSILIYING